MTFDFAKLPWEQSIPDMAGTAVHVYAPSEGRWWLIVLVSGAVAMLALILVPRPRSHSQQEQSRQSKEQERPWWQNLQ